MDFNNWKRYTSINHAKNTTDAVFQIIYTYYNIMTLIHVIRKSDGEVTVVSTQTTGRDEDYVGLSGQPLGKYAGGPKVELPKKEEQEQEEQEEQEETIHDLYEQKFGKKVPNIKKNDLEWISKKLAE